MSLTTTKNNQTQNISSTDTPLPTLNKNPNESAPPPEFASKHEQLAACTHCGRTFRASVLTKHVKVCLHGPGKKNKKTFNSAAARAKAVAQQNGVDIKLVKRLAKRATKTCDPVKVSNWRQKSADLREAMMWARGIDPSTVKKPARKTKPSKRVTKCKPAVRDIVNRHDRTKRRFVDAQPTTIRAAPRSRVRSTHTRQKVKHSVRRMNPQEISSQTRSLQQEW